MKAFMRWVERYCVRHPRFGVENLMRYLIIGNAVVWLLTLMDRTGTARYFLALNPQMVLRGQIWRLVTFVLIPDTGGIWGLLFLYFYYFIGTSMEREWAGPGGSSKARNEDICTCCAGKTDGCGTAPLETEQRGCRHPGPLCYPAQSGRPAGKAC